jgi:uncharacterized protein YjbI with pentapeptide repeats
LHNLNIEHAKLNHVKLDGAELYGSILNGAILNGAELNRAKLNGAKLERAELYEAKFNRAQLNGAALRAVRARGSALRSMSLERVKNLENLLARAFGDASVTLPEDMQPLVKDKWPDTVLGHPEFEIEWELFQKDPEAYIPPQNRNGS